MKDVLPALKTQRILVDKLFQHFLLLLRRFKGCPVIAVAAKPGGPEAPDTEEAQGISDLIEVSKWALCSQQHIKNRDRFKWRSRGCTSL